MSTSLNNILVPTDFSKQGNNAIKTAIELCKQHKATLHLMHVVEKSYVVPSPTPDVSVSALNNVVDDDTRTRLYDEYESILKNHQIRVHIHMPLGIPFDEICKAAAEMPIDLIVIGTHGVSGVREFFIGTTAYYVIKNTSTPVLTIPASFEALEFKKVLFPLRPVTGVKEKFEFVNSFLHNHNNETAIHIATLCLENGEDLLFSKKDELYEIITLLNNSKCYFSKELHVCKNYADKVLELSESLAVDLVVINATLDYEWMQCFAGPYTRQVVNHSKVPVLSFRHGAPGIAEDPGGKQIDVMLN